MSILRLCGVEGGGTTWVCAIAEGESTNIVERASFETTTPAETLGAVERWLLEREFDALGIATFGPVDACEGSPTYGHITATPKPGWRNTDVVGFLTRSLKNVPVLYDTDVNAPALAEYRAAKADGEELTSVAYVTVGTGVGVGLVVNGAPLHGLLHPEAGHISVPRRAGDTYDGHNASLDCPGWCEVEAMTASGALMRRAGLANSSGLKDLPDDSPVWDTAAHYIAAMCANLVLTASPQRIILSGGVMLRSSLFPKVRVAMVKMLNGYIPAPAVLSVEGATDYIVPSRWSNDAGLVGALTLAEDALARKPKPVISRKKRAPPPYLALCAAAVAVGFVFGRASLRKRA